MLENMTRKEAGDLGMWSIVISIMLVVFLILPVVYLVNESVDFQNDWPIFILFIMANIMTAMLIFIFLYAPLNKVSMRKRKPYENDNMNVIMVGPDGKTVDEELAEWFEKKRQETKLKDKKK